MTGAEKRRLNSTKTKKEWNKKGTDQIISYQ